MRYAAIIIPCILLILLPFASFPQPPVVNSPPYLSSDFDHGGLQGLSDDDHSQYFFLNGRAGGQIAIGGTASGDDLTLQSTSHATRGKIVFGNSSSIFDENLNRFGIGTTTPTTLTDWFSSSGSAEITLETSEDSSAGNKINLKKSRANGAALISTETLAEIYFLGSTGTGYANGAKIQVRSPGAGSWGTGANRQGDLSFWTSASGGILSERLHIDSQGEIGINTNGPDRLLDILDTTDPQLRLTHTDATIYGDVQIDANGILNKILPGKSLDDDTEITYTTGVSGKGSLIVGDAEEFADFIFAADGTVTLISNSANVVNTDTDTKFCVYDCGSGICIKNRLGSTKTVRVEVLR
jgi:hypothetical protein